MTALALTCLNRGLVRLVSEPELDSAHVLVSRSRLVQLERAAECFEQALAVNPLVASCWFTLGCVRLQQRSFGAAVAAFRRSATLEPDNFQAWANLATALVQTKQKCATPTPLLVHYIGCTAAPSCTCFRNLYLTGRRRSAFSRKPSKPTTRNGAFGRTMFSYDRLTNLASCLLNAYQCSSFCFSALKLALDCGEFKEALHGIHRLLDLKHKFSDKQVH